LLAPTEVGESSAADLAIDLKATSPSDAIAHEKVA
jgi:hypothetical protein